MTNEDKLKIIKHNELVRFFLKTGGCPIKYTFGHCPVQEYMTDVFINDDHCIKCWSDWLKEEVEEDGNR